MRQTLTKTLATLHATEKRAREFQKAAEVWRGVASVQRTISWNDAIEAAAKDMCPLMVCPDPMCEAKRIRALRKPDGGT